MNAKQTLKALSVLTLTLAMAPQLTAQNNALHFDGVDDEVYFATAPFGPIQMFLTIEFWVKRDRSDIHEVVFGYGNPSGGASNGAISIGFNAQNEFFIDYGGQVQTYAWANDTEWHHWGVTAQDPGFGVQMIYLDGQWVQDFTESIVFDPLGFNEMVLGRSLTTGADHFQGTMDDLRIDSGWRDRYYFNNFYNCRFPSSGYDNSNANMNYTFDQGVADDDNALETQLIPPIDYSFLDEGTLNNFALNGTTSNWVPGIVINECPPNMGLGTFYLDGSFPEVCVNNDFGMVYTYVNGFDVNPGADIIIELSDADGDFSNPTVYATITNAGNYESLVDIPIPIGTPPGLNYQLRVRCTDPVLVGLPANPFRIALGSLSGELTIGGLPLTDGTVTLYSMNNDPAGWEAVHQTSVTTGAYAFNNIYYLPFSWAMEVRPDPVTHPEGITTFRSWGGPIHRWDAPGFNVADSYNCFSPTVRDLEVLTEGLLNGTSTISGYIFWPEGKRMAEDPIPMMDVVVERVPPGTSFAIDQTDENGQYVFEAVPESSGDQYRIFVNVPGIPMFDTYSVTIDQPGSSFTNLNFVVDTVENFIYPYLVTSTSEVSGIEGRLSVYPNPADASVAVGLPDISGRIASVSLVSVSGKVVHESGAAAGPVTVIGTSSLASGIYALRIADSDGRVFRSTLAVQH